MQTNDKKLVSLNQPANWLINLLCTDTEQTYFFVLAHSDVECAGFETKIYFESMLQIGDSEVSGNVALPTLVVIIPKSTLTWNSNYFQDPKNKPNCSHAIIKFI